MKNRESQADDFNEIITLNMTDNQSVSQAPEVKSNVQPARMSGKKTKRDKKDTFNAPHNKKHSNNNFNINISFAEGESQAAETFQIPVPHVVEEIAEGPLFEEYKRLKAEYKKAKIELDEDPNDEAKIKAKKRSKKKLKQAKEAITSGRWKKLRDQDV